MEVKDKLTGEVFKVYAIEGDKFLVFDEEDFVWVPMKDYKPYDATIW